MGALARVKDWSETALGKIESWPQSLRFAVRHPGLVGPQAGHALQRRIQADSGRKHPAALGMSGRDCWPEIWHIIGPILAGVMERGEATWSDDLLLVLERNGYAEECYFTFSYSPIRGESGEVGGIFTPVHDTTERVIGQRRLATLERLGQISVKSKSVDEICRVAAHSVGANV